MFDMFVGVTPEIALVLFLVLVAEAANGWSDAPVGTASAVASGALSSKSALYITALGNFLGMLTALVVGAKVATTIGTGIVQPEYLTVTNIGVAMATSIIWSLFALWVGIPISKTHSLLAGLAGIGWAAGGLEALMPASGHWSDSGWVAVMKGVFVALGLAAAMAWFLTKFINRVGLGKSLSRDTWRRMQIGTVCMVATGHGLNDGLKYVGIFTLVLVTGGVIPAFQVSPMTIVLCAFVMAAGTLLGGYRIHRRMDNMVNGDTEKFHPYMGVAAEAVAGFSIWQTGWLGIPMSTNHSVVSAMVGAKSAEGKVHQGSFVRIIWGWIATYFVCFTLAWFLVGMVS